MVDEFAAVIAMELSKREGKAAVNVLEGLESPCMSLIEEGIQANPA
jgi:hypothetical protein